MPGDITRKDGRYGAEPLDAGLHYRIQVVRKKSAEVVCGRGR